VDCKNKIFNKMFVLGVVGYEIFSLKHTYVKSSSKTNLGCFDLKCNHLKSNVATNEHSNLIKSVKETSK
jgi:hypothetical protein